jgi:hypothetical protein
MDAANAARIAAKEAERSAAFAEIDRRTNVETMNRGELERAVPGYLKMRDIADGLHKKALEQLAGIAA